MHVNKTHVSLSTLFSFQQKNQLQSQISRQSQFFLLHQLSTPQNVFKYHNPHSQCSIFHFPPQQLNFIIKVALKTQRLWFIFNITVCDLLLFLLHNISVCKYKYSLDVKEEKKESAVKQSSLSHSAKGSLPPLMIPPGDGGRRKEKNSEKNCRDRKRRTLSLKLQLRFSCCSVGFSLSLSLSVSFSLSRASKENP